MKITSEYDSEEQVVRSKATVRLLDGKVKLKASCDAFPTEKQIIGPTLSFSSTPLSATYDVPTKDGVLSLSTKLGRNLKIGYEHHLQDNEGAILLDGFTKDRILTASAIFEVSTRAVSTATLRHPLGALRYRHYDNVDYPLGISAMITLPIGMGLFVAEAANETRSLDLSYKYKDDDITVEPTINIPTGDTSFTFKRRLNQLNKISFEYRPTEIAWSVNFKRKWNVDPMTGITSSPVLKAGYVSQRKAFYACLWSGRPTEAAKEAPWWGKAKVMAYMPQDFKDPDVMVSWKKRWEF